MRNNQLAEDFNACLAVRDARAAENAQARARCRANAELVQALAQEAQRRGRSEIDWPEYFRNIDINYP